jgi:hypothetical protein
MEVALHECAREFIEKGSVVLNIPYSAYYARGVAAGFENFLNQVSPLDREDWSFNVGDNEDPDKAPDDGFIPRHGERRLLSGGRYDDKFVFHYRPRLMDLLLDRNINLKPWRSWLSYCDRLYRICLRAEQEFISTVEEVMPGYGLLDCFTDPSVEDAHVIRIIKYAERGVEDPLILGKRHFDRNFLTGCVGESHPGLRIYPSGDEPVSYIAQPDQVLVFPGKKFETITSGKVKALAHDIVNQTPGLSSRWSVIFFGHAKVTQ